MAVTETPHVSISKLENSVNGDGAYIPVIIGQTGNTIVADNIEIQTFTGWEEIFASLNNGGIGTDLETNKSLSFLKYFLEECTPINVEDIGMPKIYFIDMGSIPFSNGDAWANAFELAKTKKDAKAEIIVGFQKADKTNAEDKSLSNEEIATIVGILESANNKIETSASKGILRQLYFTVQDATDEDLMKITATTSARHIQQPRVLPMEPKFFPQLAARYCLTPYYVEPGFLEFRTVSLDDVIERTETMETNMQNAGINFIRKEMVTKGEITRICLGVSSAKASSTYKEGDELPHARRNTDNLLERCYLKCCDVLKDNETNYAVDMLQTEIDDIVDDEISKKRMLNGTQLTVSEAQIKPFHVVLKGKSKPVNSIHYINIEYYIQVPSISA